MAFSIKTDKGWIYPLVGYYNGVFPDPDPIGRKSKDNITYESEQIVSILYAYDVDQVLGSAELSNRAAKINITRTPAYSVTYTFTDDDNVSYYYSSEPDSAGRFSILVAIFDTEGKIALYNARSATFYPSDFSHVVLPADGKFGHATFLKTGWNKTYFYYRDVDRWLKADTPDPYSPGGASTHGGGGRSFDNTSDPVAIPSLPADPVLNSGFVTMYQMDVLKLNSLANFLWNESLFDTETWQKVLANPFDAIISLNYIPASPNVLSDRSIQIGNVTTNVSAAPVADQFVQIDCQTLDVEEYGGTYLDYNPYTKVEIYLPYIGFRDLNTDEVMDKTLHLIYNVDIVTGTCVANILVDNTVLYQFTGNCALSIPLTGRDAGKNFAALLSLISAGAVVGAGAYSGTLDAAGAVKAVSATAQAVMGAKRNIQRSGSVSGAAGFMGGQTPYLIITRPRQALPESQNSFTGYPSFITENLSDLAGFTTIESIHLEGIPGTSAEIAEIESLLSSGVIL